MTPPARDYPQLARALGARREQLGLTPADVDALAGLPFRYTRRLEAGTAVLTPRTLAPLLSVLGIRLIIQPIARAAS